MIYKRKNKKLRRRIKKILIILLPILVAFFIYFETVAIPYQRNLIESRAKIVAEEAINSGIEDVLSNREYSYNDFSDIVYSSTNQVQSVSINSLSVNKFKNAVNDAILSKLKENHPVVFYAPLGSFTGLTLLSNDGPPVKIAFRLAGSFNSEIVSTFESAGVNQTVHHLVLNVEANVVSTCPGYTKQVKLKTNYEIAQTVIVGDIPNLYAGLNGLNVNN